MAVPPTYSDLGKSAKDIFNKGFGELNFMPSYLYKSAISRSCLNKNSVYVEYVVNLML